MTLAAQCEASPFSVLYGAATVMERGSVEFFNSLLGRVRQSFVLLNMGSDPQLLLPAGKNSFLEPLRSIPR